MKRICAWCGANLGPSTAVDGNRSPIPRWALAGGFYALCRSEIEADFLLVKEADLSKAVRVVGSLHTVLT
jgi:hypothetical protein